MKSTLSVMLKSKSQKVKENFEDLRFVTNKWKKCSFKFFGFTFIRYTYQFEFHGPCLTFSLLISILAGSMLVAIVAVLSKKASVMTKSKGTRKWRTNAVAGMTSATRRRRPSRGRVLPAIYVYDCLVLRPENNRLPQKTTLHSTSRRK